MPSIFINNAIAAQRRAQDVHMGYSGESAGELVHDWDWSIANKGKRVYDVRTKPNTCIKKV